MIFVDDIRNYNHSRYGPSPWCHMMSDDPTEAGLAELHAIAARIGIPRRGFQNHPRHPHYDLTPAARTRAIELGATPVSSKELVRRCVLPRRTAE